MSSVVIREYGRYVADQVRSEAYARAIGAVVRPGQRVLDVGCGFGLLSLLAARAGAREVIAIEQLETVELARALARDNGLEDRIRFIRGNSAQVPAEPVDVVVAEIFGTLALEEFAVEYLHDARTRWLTPGGQMIPGDVALHFVPIEHPESAAQIARTYGPQWGDVLGLDLRRLRQIAYENWATPYMVHAVDAHARWLAPSICAFRSDFTTVNRSYFRQRLSFTIAEAGTLHAVCGYFTSTLAPDVELSTSPRAPQTHWYQALVPVVPARTVTQGDRVEMEVAFGEGGRWTLDVLPVEGGEP